MSSTQARRRQAAAPVAPRGTLPAPISSFIGREQALDQVHQLLKSARLVTLTGPGGVGKTRLAVEVASRMVNDFVDGVFFVSLAPVSDAALVTPAIAQVLGVREVSTTPLVKALQAHLHGRALLLLLDNFEHVVAAAPVVADLLMADSGLRVLVTSRAPLHIRGEREVAVAPLELPELQVPAEPAVLLGAEAVRLF